VAIVKANYLRSGGGSRIGRSVDYYGWREGTEVERTWHAADGRELDQDAAKDEIAGKAEEAPYTYRVVLSTREAELDADDYAAVLDERFDDWYFTTHLEGDHPHAHAVAFRDERLDRDDLADLRERLGELERAHEQALEQAPEAELEPGE